MRYEARVKQQIGPLTTAALGCTHEELRLSGTRLTITCRAPLPLTELVSLLDRLGVEIDEVHRSSSGPIP